MHSNDRSCFIKFSGRYAKESQLMLRIRDIGIGVRLGTGFGVLMALAAVMGLIGLRYMTEINERVENMYTQELVTIEALDDAKSATYRIRGDSLEHILADREISMSQLAAEINQQQQRVGERIRQYQATRLSVEEKVLVSTFEKHFQTYINRVEKEILPLSSRGRKAEAEVLARGAAVEEFRKARVAMNELMDYSLKRAGIRYQNAVANYKEAFWTVITIIAIISALGALVSYFLTRTIVRPLKRVIGYFNEIANGNLENEIEIHGHDEIGRVLLALEDTQTKLGSNINQRRQAESALIQAHKELETKVSERTRELAEANERLKEIDRLKSEFLATMSHELRTPLNSIIGFTGMVLQGLAGPVNDEQTKQLSMVYGSAKHLLSLINDILDLSKIESGRMEVLQDPLDLREIMTEAAQSLEPMIAQKKLHLHLHIPNGIPTIFSDRKKIVQILLNLLNNAVKFTDTGKITLRCELSGAEIKITVSDTGCGIRDTDMKLLFSAFRQISNTDRREHGGAGLGLYLCQKLVILLRGKIRVESTYGKGSSFIFTLPAERQAVLWQGNP